MREALKLALVALDDRTSLTKWQIARDAVKEALAQPEQEPVGFIEAKADNECADAYADGWNACVRAHKDTTPPKRPWVGLTDEEVLGCLGPEAVRIPPGWSKLTRAVEAKLKEKNFD